MRCRARRKVNNKTYYEKHKEQLNEYSKAYREENKEERKLYDKEIYKIQIKFPNCNSEVCKSKLARHQRTQPCKLIAYSKNNTFKIIFLIIITKNFILSRISKMV